MWKRINADIRVDYTTVVGVSRVIGFMSIPVAAFMAAATMEFATTAGITLASTTMGTAPILTAVTGMAVTAAVIDSSQPCGDRQYSFPDLSRQILRKRSPANNLSVVF